jgi:hypothetical protein
MPEFEKTAVTTIAFRTTEFKTPGLALGLMRGPRRYELSGKKIFALLRAMSATVRRQNQYPAPIAALAS